MVDNENREITTEQSGGAPIHRDEPPRDGAIAGGEVKAAAEDAVPGASAESPEARPAAAEEDVRPRPAAASALPPRQPPASKGPGAGLALVSGAVGGAIVAALAAGYFLQFPPKGELSESDLSRLAAVETAVGHDSAAIAGLDKRIGALEAAKAAAPKNDEGAEAVSAEIPALAARLDKLEKEPPAPDLSALTSRMQKLEDAVAAAKAPEPGGNPAAVAIVAETIRDKLATGAPYTAELSALTGLGVDPAKLAALKPLAGGAPTTNALAASFQSVEPKLFAAIAPKETGTVAERMLAHVRSLVQIRDVGEVQGDDPQAVASQVLGDLRRGDLGAALAAFAKLPEPARDAAAGFAADAKSKLEAIAAAQSIRDAAVARLAEAKP
ncbi:hypothetical protein DFR50_11885 [Roseiarcus fermentans]|uniref:Inner membrane protein n=1 Tax=Roseiarcus fermentans TaxID=1473586 RepID=A0A366FA08_9HYPH|nr:mitofilin family membrane protein [Roseiarcus fermentans]RBP10599.1 hypothetical protein DFR50_11885 [Roseiarcus fermentans]